MSDGGTLTLRARALPDGGLELLSTGVGLWTDAPARGTLLEPGDSAGLLWTLGRARTLLVPEGAAGCVAGDPPEPRHAAVGWGETLLRLEPAAVEGGAPAPPLARAEGAGLLLRAPQAGRFWCRPEPGAPPYLGDGETLEEGRTYGLLEVMKTFQPLKHRAAGELPARARWLRYLAADGAEVADGEPVAELGPL